MQVEIKGEWEATSWSCHDVISPWCIGDSGSCSVCLCMYLSICYHESCYIPCLYVKNKVSWSSLQCFKIFVTWLLLKTVCLKVLVSFVDHCSLPRSLTSSRWTQGTDMYFFSTRMVYMQLMIAPTTQLTDHSTLADKLLWLSMSACCMLIWYTWCCCWFCCILVVVTLWSSYCICASCSVHQAARVLHYSDAYMWFSACLCW